MKKSILFILITVFLGSCGENNETEIADIDTVIVDEDLIEPPNCSADSSTGILKQCSDQKRVCINAGDSAICGKCIKGYTEENNACRPVIKCSDINCQEKNKLCSEADDQTDAICRGCADGFLEISGQCARPNCNDGAIGSIKNECEIFKRNCFEDAAGAQCSSCKPNYIEIGDTCEKAIVCIELNCSENNRKCTSKTETNHAKCGRCLEGFEENEGVCISDKDKTCQADEKNSIADKCKAKNRECITDEQGSRCGECSEGMIKIDDVCSNKLSCADLNCEKNELKHCSDEPTGHCTTCLPGYVKDEETKKCRETVKCDSIPSCPTGQTCVQAGDYSDAFCRKTCPEQSIWNGRRCEPCPPCKPTDLGEAGAWVWPTAAGNCICETSEGYYYSVGADMGPVPCDADGDGWVRESARIAMNSNDPNIAANARCNVRTIDKFILINEEGKQVVVTVPPIELFETDRNDDDTILSAIWKERSLPRYGDNGRNLLAKEINRLTKFCHNVYVDYNDNGVADVDENPTLKASESMRPEQVVFNKFSYFSELHNAYYKAPENGEKNGSYVIQERKRSIQNPDLMNKHVPFNYPKEDGAYWRQCKVLRDTKFPDNRITMDFAEYSKDPDSNNPLMTHHSLFKCIVIDNNSDPKELYKVTPEEFAIEAYKPNRCDVKKQPVNVEGNPAETMFDCNSVTNTSSYITPGRVTWAMAPYRDHGRWSSGKAEYIRGCYNQCIGNTKTLCNIEETSETFMCQIDIHNYGKFKSCDAWEICDGKDNDADGKIDEEILGEGLLCDTGNLGICKLGEKTCCLAGHNGMYDCNVGEMFCKQTEAAQTEICNGVDDNCDGIVDAIIETTADGKKIEKPLYYPPEKPENEKTICDNTGEEGICKFGKFACKDGTFDVETCIADIKPGQMREWCIPKEDALELQANGTYSLSPMYGKDEDCDGVPDEVPSREEVLQMKEELGDTHDFGDDLDCPLPWKRYYIDKDGDGFGDRNDSECLCSPKGLYTAEKIVDDSGEELFDCCDKDAKAFPGCTKYTVEQQINIISQEGITALNNFAIDKKCFHNERNACGRFDYNCDGREEGKATFMGYSSATKYPSKVSGTTCQSETESCWDGWKDFIPQCGEKANYISCADNTRTVEYCRHHFFFCWSVGVYTINECKRILSSRRQECR